MTGCLMKIVWSITHMQRSQVEVMMMAAGKKNTHFAKVGISFVFQIHSSMVFKEVFA